MNDFEKHTREELVYHLTIGHAHMKFEDVVADFPEDHINDMFTNGDYTFWHLLEHMRRTQADILNFSTNPNYEELSWPDDYWPKKDAKATKEDWDKTIKDFLKDREKLQKLIEDPNNDIYEVFPWGDGQTLAREVSVVTDHNSYHLGEFSIMRQTLNTWPVGHR
ncbi:MAG TPA: DinB family protein [Patescibacteria group bacterium]|nr:DinB family protein [Patescibacteria group bacterium]